MTKQEYMDNVKKYPENAERIRVISDRYGTEINGLIAQIVSFADNADFIGEERRAFTFNEILNAAKEYDIDFKALGIIPIIDAYDNELIVYVIADNIWAKYSVSDDVLFKKRASLEEIL